MSHRERMRAPPSIPRENHITRTRLSLSELEHFIEYVGIIRHMLSKSTQVSRYGWTPVDISATSWRRVDALTGLGWPMEDDPRG